MNYIAIAYSDLAIALSLIVITLLISYKERLGLEKDLLCILEAHLYWPPHACCSIVVLHIRNLCYSPRHSR